MIKYAKICDQNTKACIVGLGDNQQYYLEEGFQKLDVEQAYNNCWYLKGYAPKQQLNEIKQEFYNKLWNNFKTYQTIRCDAEDLVLASMGSLGGYSKCTAVRDWVMNLWKIYYTKKDLIKNAESEEIIRSIDITANECGELPYSIRELNQQVNQQ